MSMNSRDKKWLMLILPFALILVGILGMFVVALSQRAGDNVRVTWNDQVQLEVYPLEEDRTLTYEGENGQVNVLKIQDGQVFMESANCPDQVCVNHGPTSETADPIVCLPNRLVVEVIPGDEMLLDGNPEE